MSAARAPSLRRRLGRWFAALVILVGVVLGVICGLEHRAERAAWQVQSERLSAAAPTYDAAASDAHYAAAMRWRGWAERAGQLTAFGAVWLLFCLPQVRTGGAEERGRATHLAALLDGGASAGLLIGFARVESWLGPDLGATGAFLGVSMLGVAIGLVAGGVSRGLTLGGRICGPGASDSSGRPPGIVRGFAAGALLPFAVMWAPLALLFAPRSRPPHLRWTGLRAAATAGRQI